MFTITKQQRDYLEKNGCTFPEDLHKNHGKYNSYYATESPKVKALLKQYDKSRKTMK